MGNTTCSFLKWSQGGIWMSKIEGVHQVHHKIQPTCLVIHFHPILGYGILGLPTATYTQAMKALLTMDSFCFIQRSFRSHQFNSREPPLPTGRRVGAADSRGVVFADALVSWRWGDQQEL